MSPPFLGGPTRSVEWLWIIAVVILLAALWWMFGT